MKMEAETSEISHENSDSNKESVPSHSTQSNCPDSVVILPEAVETAKKVQALKLRHPHTKAGVMFLLDYDNCKLYELNAIESGQRSFFIKDNVMSNGDIILATAFDPIYLILPYLMQANQNTPLLDLLEDEKYPKMVELLQFYGDLSCIADQLGSADLQVWKYNEKLALKLLEERTLKLKELLQKKKEQIIVGNYTKKLDSATYLRMAYGILSEYLCDEFAKTLKVHLKIPEEQKLETPEVKGLKKLRVSEPSEDFSRGTPDAKAKVNLSAKEKALAKSAKGSKSITSFFTKR